jgi:hypothetical protein
MYDREWAYEIDLDPERFRLGLPLRWQYDEAVTMVTFQYGPDPDETLDLPFLNASAIVALVREADNPLVDWMAEVDARTTTG